MGNNILKAVELSKTGLSEYVGSIYTTVIDKIRGLKPLQKGESFGHIWKIGERKPHAGQIFRRKVMPNGNINETMITAYCGEGTPLAYERIIYNPKGEVVHASNGFINPGLSTQAIEKHNKIAKDMGFGKEISSIGSCEYISTLEAPLKDVAKKGRTLYNNQPDAQRLSYSPRVCMPNIYSSIVNKLSL